MIFLLAILLVMQQIVKCLSKAHENYGVCNRNPFRDRDLVFFICFLPLQVYFLYLTHSFHYRGTVNRFDDSGNLVVEVLYKRDGRDRVAYLVNGNRIDQTNNLMLIRYPIVRTMMQESHYRMQETC